MFLDFIGKFIIICQMTEIMETDKKLRFSRGGGGVEFLKLALTRIWTTLKILFPRITFFNLSFVTTPLFFSLLIYYLSKEVAWVDVCSVIKSSYQKTKNIGLRLQHSFNVNFCVLEYESATLHPSAAVYLPAVHTRTVADSVPHPGAAFRSRYLL